MGSGSLGVPAEVLGTSETRQGGASTLVGFEGVTRYFAGAIHPFIAVEDFSLVIGRGEFMGLVGPSGCGKSTLLKILAGLLGPSKGEVTFEGRVVNHPLPEIGLLFQTPTLFPWRSVLRNVTLPLEVAHADKGLIREAANKMLEFVGLSQFESHYPRQLSGGMQQRVALARLLVSDPKLMLMDEPFAALDELTRERLNTELARISEGSGKTSVFVTHNIGEAVFLCDRIAVMASSPGRLAGVVEVDLPRPRTPELRGTQRYTEIAFTVRRILGVA